MFGISIYICKYTERDQNRYAFNQLIVITFGGWQEDAEVEWTVSSLSVVCLAPLPLENFCSLLNVVLVRLSITVINCPHHTHNTHSHPGVGTWPSSGKWWYLTSVVKVIGSEWICDQEESVLLRIALWIKWAFHKFRPLWEPSQYTEKQSLDNIWAPGCSYSWSLALRLSSCMNQYIPMGR